MITVQSWQFKVENSGCSNMCFELWAKISSIKLSPAHQSMSYNALSHYGDITWRPQPLKSMAMASRLFVQQFIQVTKKTPKLHITDFLWGESTGFWWITLTKGQQYRKHFHVMTLWVLLTHCDWVTHICQENNHHWFRYWLVAWPAPSHYLNQCWNIVDWTLENKFQ